ncbi:hypothetical protein Tco_0956079 [Tanacetum coccineum]|uniref:Uncharacterized protein n=1 Tax=Tanacetum coccineum TaxID=301880 RepID=A0ABQ5E922_9ASTR
MSENVKTLENVIEDEPHLFMEIVDNDLRALTMITKHFVSKHGRGIIGSQWQKLWWQRWFHDGKRWWLVSQMLVVSNEGLSGGGLVVYRGKSSRELKNRAGGDKVIGSEVEIGSDQRVLGGDPRKQWVKGV